MSNIAALAAGAVVGVVVGWACERMPIAPVLQTVGAAIGSLLLASILAGLVWIISPPPAAEIKAVTFGFSESGLVLVGAVGASVALHYVLAWVGLTNHRALLVSILAGLCGALSVVSGTGWAERIGR